jgi:hypothetical protein
MAGRFNPIGTRSERAGPLKSPMRGTSGGTDRSMIDGARRGVLTRIISG